MVILTALVALLVEGDVAHNPSLGMVHRLLALGALRGGRSLEGHGCGDSGSWSETVVLRVSITHPY